MRFKFLTPLLALLLLPQTVFASDPPQLSSPSDGATAFSSKLEWQAPSYQLCSTADPYRVQVDDNPSFPSASVNKNTYTKNTYYTPQLSDGLWYWRVMVRDESCSWSLWSSVWSFTLTSNSSNPSPSPTSNPSADSTPPPSPTTTPTSQSTPQPSSQSSLFVISEVPSQINSDQLVSVSVNLLLPNNPNSTFYLKGAFKRADSSNYFGYTKVSGDWIKNGSSYSSQLPITTDSSGSWTGSLEVKVDSEDSGFEGSGDYIFKVGRYTSSGSGPTWSNELTVSITAVGMESSNEGGTGGSDISSSSPPKTSSIANSTSKTNFNKASIIRTSQNLEEDESSVAGIQSSPNPLPEEEILVERKVNYIPWVGGGFILAGLSSLGLLYLKNKGIHEKLFKQIR